MLTGVDRSVDDSGFGASLHNSRREYCGTRRLYRGKLWFQRNSTFALGEKSAFNTLKDNKKHSIRINGAAKRKYVLG